MALIAGFCGFGGVVLCADSQETVANYSKRTVSKIHITHRDTFDFACAGSGSGPYVDMVTTQLAFTVEHCAEMSPTTASEIIQKVLAEHYSTHVWSRDERAQDEAKLELLVVSTGSPGGPFLFHALDTAVNWIHDWKTIGVGGYLADYLLEHLLSPYGDQYHLLAVGAYVTKKARDYIEGCGKESEVYLFPRVRSAIWFYPEELSTVEAVLDEFDGCVKDIFIGVTDRRSKTISKDAMEGALANFRRVEAKMEQLVKDREARLARAQLWRARSKPDKD